MFCNHCSIFILPPVSFPLCSMASERIKGISPSTVFTVFIEVVVMRHHDPFRNSSDLINSSWFIQSCTGHSHMIKFPRAMTGRFYATTFLKFLSREAAAKPVKHSKLTDRKLQSIVTCIYNNVFYKAASYWVILRCGKPIYSLYFYFLFLIVQLSDIFKRQFCCWSPEFLYR